MLTWSTMLRRPPRSRAKTQQQVVEADGVVLDMPGGGCTSTVTSCTFPPAKQQRWACSWLTRVRSSTAPHSPRRHGAPNQHTTTTWTASSAGYAVEYSPARYLPPGSVESATPATPSAPHRWNRHDHTQSFGTPATLGVRPPHRGARRYLGLGALGVEHQPVHGGRRRDHRRHRRRASPAAYPPARHRPTPDEKSR